MNAKDEFLDHVKGKSVKAAEISCGEKFLLLEGFDEADYVSFINDLDFEYDESYGTQELFGTIWYEDGTWSDRGEYDGSEWWEYRKCPPLPGEETPLSRLKDAIINAGGVWPDDWDDAESKRILRDYVEADE